MGRSSRLIILHRSCNCSDHIEFTSRFPDYARSLEDMILVSDSWMYRKHEVELHSRSAPWHVLGVVDSRLTHDERFEIADAFVNRPSCCQDEWFSRRFLQKFQCAGEDLLHEDMQRVLAAWARTVKLTVAPVEVLHAHNKRLLQQSHGKRVSNFVAEYTNEQVLTLQRTRLDERAQSEPAQRKRQADGGDDGVGQKRTKLTVKQSAKKIYFNRVHSVFQGSLRG